MSSSSDTNTHDTHDHNDDATSTSKSKEMSPQAVATGYSQNPDMILAIQEASQSALASLPPRANISLAIVHVSSIYDGQHSPTQVVPTIVQLCREKGHEVQTLIGCYAGGLIGTTHSGSGSNGDGDGDGGPITITRGPSTVESEGVAAIAISFLVLPSTTIRTFHLTGEDLPDDGGASMSPQQWKECAGMSRIGSESDTDTDTDTDDDTDDDTDNDKYSFMILPAPSFQKVQDEFLRGLQTSFPHSTTFGAIASTVSSLSRAKLFRYEYEYDVDRPDGDVNVNVTSASASASALTEGCVGIAMRGDVELKVMLAQGSKPVGGVYSIVKGEECTIRAIQLDAEATEELQAAEEGQDGDHQEDEDEEEDDDSQEDVKERMAAAYAKAVIPKPVLAECNYIMKSLSDDDQEYMRKYILVGIERGGSMLGKNASPSELIRLTQGWGHRFKVHQVASAGMKDGSVTLPLGSVDVEPGMRMRFFVRDGEFAKKEVKAIWTGYKTRELETSFVDNSDVDGADGADGADSGDADGADSGDAEQPFNPAGCLVFPTLDRGQKLFGGKAGFESHAISEFAPSVPSISGFFSNGVIAAMDDGQVTVHESASCYALIGSKSNRPIYSAAQASASEEARVEEEIARQEEEAERAAEALNEESTSMDGDQPAPRSEDGELIIKRREVHSGRALTVSAVQWSVAEKMAKPSSALEGFMWDKETEVDRFRERVPLSNLVSQCRLSDLDPSKPKPRDWIGPVKEAAKESFVIIPELKRMEPAKGSLRKRYDINKLTKQVVKANVPAFVINGDQVLFGGCLDDITEGREAASKAILDSSNAEEGAVAPPILASDLILYPYQLYKLRLAGADAVNLVAGALTSKDLLYLSKIASSMKMNVVASVTSEVQIKSITNLGGGISAVSVSNRDLETFALDDSGEQALRLLKSEAMKEFKTINPDAFIFAEGGVGAIEMEGEDVKGEKYIQALKDAGAMGAIIGGVNWADWHQGQATSTAADLA
jgi:indole-3-glycerol phosphate synthase